MSEQPDAMRVLGFVVIMVFLTVAVVYVGAMVYTFMEIAACPDRPWDSTPKFDSR